MDTFRMLGLKKVLLLKDEDIKAVFSRLKRIKNKIPPKSIEFFSKYGIDTTNISSKDELNGYLSYLGVMYYYKKEKSLYRRIKCLIRSLKR